jgi:pantetheine-phosphate adenylyltransferase
MATKRIDERLRVKAIYPGSFDPVTKGHLDIIQRAAPTLHKLVVAVADNPNKKQCFTIDERKEFLREVTKNMPNVEIDSFNTLLVDYVKQKNIRVIIRGLRAVTDFEMEFQMALINKSLLPTAETIFLVTSTEYSFLSSSIIKEVAQYGGDVTHFVHPLVAQGLYQKFGIKR